MKSASVMQRHNTGAHWLTLGPLNIFPLHSATRSYETQTRRTKVHWPTEQPAGQLAGVRERLEEQRAVARQAHAQLPHAHDQAACGALALSGRGRIALLQLVVREAAAHALGHHLRQRLRQGQACPMRLLLRCHTVAHSLHGRAWP